MATISKSISGNAVTARVIFRDSMNQPVDPDGPVRWRVLAADRRTVIDELEQGPGSPGHTATGTFQLRYVPELQAGESYAVLYFEAAADVDGDRQLGRVAHVVSWVE